MRSLRLCINLKIYFIILICFQPAWCYNNNTISSSRHFLPSVCQSEPCSQWFCPKSSYNWLSAYEGVIYRSWEILKLSWMRTLRHCPTNGKDPVMRKCYFSVPFKTRVYLKKGSAISKALKIHFSMYTV